LDSHFGRDSVNIDYVKYSSNNLYRIIALYKSSELHYITLMPGANFLPQPSILEPYHPIGPR